MIKRALMSKSDDVTLHGGATSAVLPRIWMREFFYCDLPFLTSEPHLLATWLLHQSQQKIGPFRPSV
jgi:hypothetical protein